MKYGEVEKDDENLIARDGEKEQPTSGTNIRMQSSRDDAVAKTNLQRSAVVFKYPNTMLNL